MAEIISTAIYRFEGDNAPLKATIKENEALLAGSEDNVAKSASKAATASAKAAEKAVAEETKKTNFFSKAKDTVIPKITDKERVK